MSDSGGDYSHRQRVTFQDQRNTGCLKTSRQRYSSHPGLVQCGDDDVLSHDRPEIRISNGRVDLDSDVDSELDHLSWSKRGQTYTDRGLRRRNVTSRGRGMRARSVTPVRGSSRYDSDMGIHRASPAIVIPDTAKLKSTKHSGNTGASHQGKGENVEKMLPNGAQRSHVVQSDHAYSSSSESEVKGHQRSHAAKNIKSSSETTSSDRNTLIHKPPSGLKSKVKTKGAVTEIKDQKGINVTEKNTKQIFIDKDVPLLESDGKKSKINSNDGYSEIEFSQPMASSISRTVDEDPYETVEIIGGTPVKNKGSDRLTDTDSGIMSHEGSIPQSSADVKGQDGSMVKGYNLQKYLPGIIVLCSLICKFYLIFSLHLSLIF